MSSFSHADRQTTNGPHSAGLLLDTSVAARPNTISLYKSVGAAVQTLPAPRVYEQAIQLGVGQTVDPCHPKELR